jgi:hypothetical protein
LRDILNGLRIRIFKMFGPFRLHPELGGAVIVNPSEAAMFIQRLNSADKGKPHWRLAMSMIETAATSEEQEERAASAFATALKTEMWLED